MFYTVIPICNTWFYFSNIRNQKKKPNKRKQVKSLSTFISNDNENLAI